MPVPYRAARGFRFGRGDRMTLRCFAATVDDSRHANAWRHGEFHRHPDLHWNDLALDFGIARHNLGDLSGIRAVTV